jgi:hypothetical protein
MRKSVLAVVVGFGLSASALYLLAAKPVAAAQTEQPSVIFNADGTVQLPTGFRKWTFVGAPLTPEGLNDGKYNCDAAGANCTRSNFPEYHHVYIEQKNVDAYLRTGDFPEGTVIVKELTRLPRFQPRRKSSRHSAASLAARMSDIQEIRDRTAKCSSAGRSTSRSARAHQPSRRRRQTSQLIFASDDRPAAGYTALRRARRLRTASRRPAAAPNVRLDTGRPHLAA